MCSIVEDDFGDDGGVHAMIADVEADGGCDLIKESASELCNKCKIGVATFKLPFRQAECRECFLLYARHKFRATLGSSKVMPKDANVLLVFDGSAESVVLLDMLHHAQTQNTFKRLHCTATVLYIDDFQLVEQNSSSDDYNNFLSEMEIFLKQYIYFNCFVVPMVNESEVINCICNIKNIKEHKYYLQHGDRKESLIGLINSIKSLSSRQDFVKHHRSKIIAAVAKHLKCTFAFVADISPDLASDLLVAVSLGRGGSAALDVALIDDRLSYGIKLIRPLKDLNTREIDLYLKAQNLQPLQNLRYGLKMGSMASLQNLTKSFVDNLQQNFSATISTVFRTGDKIAVNRDVELRMEKLKLDDADDLKFENKCCSFCNSFLDYHDSPTLLAIEFSRLVSESGYSSNKSTDLNVMAKENVEGLIENPYSKKLCHACRNIYIDSPNKNLLT